MTHILLVEDEDHIANGLKFNLEMENYTVTHVKDGEKARQILFDEKKQFDLLILDVNLPGMSGFDLCFALRKAKNFTPILMLTAKDFQKDKITGLQLGADDYVTKPFNLEELLIRIEAVLRRHQWSQAGSTEESTELNQLTFRNVMIDFDSFVVTVGNESIKMTNLEFKLMKYFAENEGKVLSREDLLKNVWNIDSYGNFRTIDNFILRLRKFFETDPSHPLHFHSIRGVGYKFTIEESLI